MTLTPHQQLTDQQRERILALARREESDSGRRPFGETVHQALLDPQQSPEIVHWLWHAPDLQAYGAYVVGEQLLEITAQPDIPQAAHELLGSIKAQTTSARLWAHGDRAQARVAAALAGIPVQRELLIMGRSLSELPGVQSTHADADTSHVTIRPFADVDEVALLQLNAAAFVDLPDQAGMTATQLRQQQQQPWSDPDGFLVAEQGGRLVGFHWAKHDRDARFDGQVSGEVYVLAVGDDQRGTGLAVRLLRQGLDYLRRQHLAHVHLYVDAQNVSAIRFYDRAGFTVIDSDREFVW